MYITMFVMILSQCNTNSKVHCTLCILYTVYIVRCVHCTLCTSYTVYSTLWPREVGESDPCVSVTVYCLLYQSQCLPTLFILPQPPPQTAGQRSLGLIHLVSWNITQLVEVISSNHNRIVLVYT